MSIETYISIMVVLFASLILVLIDAISKLKRYKKEFKRTTFSMITNNGFYKTLLNKKASNQCALFETLEKTCMTGHLLADVKIRNEKDETALFDIIMIDKYGISCFDIITEVGTMSGNSLMPFWRLKRGIFNHKIPNYSLVMNRKMEILKNVLKISDTSIINGYLICDKSAKFTNMHIDNKHLKILKRAYVNGALSYELANSSRVISDSEIMAYTIMLEKYTSLPLYIRDEKLVLADDNNESVSHESSSYTFELVKQVTSYNDLKRIWEVLSKCDKDVYPPYSQLRKDIEDIPSYARELLIPNIFYKHIIHFPMILVRYKGQIVGFLSFEPNKILKMSEELGRVNLINAVCVLREYRKDGLLLDLYKYMEVRLPEEYYLKYILIKSSQRNEQTNNMLAKLGYKEKIVVDTKKLYGTSTIYYFKKVK